MRNVGPIEPTTEPRENQLIALNAQIRNIKVGGPSSKMDKPSISVKPPSKKDEKIKKAKSKRNSDPYTTDQAWKWVASNSGEAKNKNSQRKDSYWCTNHQHKDTKRKESGSYMSHPNVMP
jgi:hypothetical protein